MSHERTWAKALDKRATDGARFIRLVDDDGKTLYVVEVMEIHRSHADQARTVAAMVELLNAIEAKP